MTGIPGNRSPAIASAAPRMSRALVATAVAFAALAIPAAHAQQEPQQPITWRGATLAQWLDPAFVPIVHTPEKLFADRATPADALAAFGVKGDPKQFLRDALASNDREEATMRILLPVLPDLPDAREYTELLLQRWRRNREDAAVLWALLRIAPETWPVVTTEVRTTVQRWPTRGHPLIAAIPAEAALDDDWQRLLAKLLDEPARDGIRILPTRPATLTRCRHWQEQLANGALPDSGDFDAFLPDPAVLGPQLDGIAGRLQEALTLLEGRHMHIWDCDGGSNFPLHQSRLLGGAGPAALPKITELLASESAAHRHAGLLALGELARGDSRQATKVLAALQQTAARPKVLEEWNAAAAMCRIAGPAVVPLLIGALRDRRQTVVELALSGLLLLHGQPMNGGDPVPVAAKQQDPRFDRKLLQPLFDGEARFLDNRTLAVQLAAVLERARPMTDAEFATFEKQALAATTMTTDLYLDTCRCVEYRGDWLQYLSVRCKGEVKDLLLAIATRTPSWDPWDPMRGILLPSWHSRVLSLDRGSNNEKLPHGYIDQLARLDPDLFVREFARQCLTR